MSKRRRQARLAEAAVGLVLTALTVGGCATEVDRDVPVGETGVVTPTTEFLVEGSTAELLDQLLAEAGALSEAIVNNEGQHDIVDRIDVIWATARPDVESEAPNQLIEFDRAIVMLHTGVDRRRPADADKAYNNLRNLVTAVG